jgi:hypothetical protein
VSLAEVNTTSAAGGRNHRRRGGAAKLHHGLPPGHYGPFPTWSHSMRAKFNSIDSVQPSRAVEYALGSDFTSEYGELESGHISIDPSTKTAVLSGKYTSGYKWNRVIGKFPITYRADYRGNK